ncbi:hypothetical protein B0T16DRAFT_457763 [Cercophora newfieldiana]|uniref:GS catalytic domain-containing protein n=1 Tax=Cercophora newfieldiana TaxID=92897 RepID=A0AA40CNT7_9PEZI|nr:hypothetical protein B0T16DRAFT_457763 [Cercophora newfieldiana]
MDITNTEAVVLVDRFFASYPNVRAIVMCFTAHLGLGDPFSRCPRALLVRALDSIARQQGHSEGGDPGILMGFEIEFVLLTPSGDGLAQEVVLAVEAAGVPVYHFHVEIANQFEIALAPLAPLQAIDALMMAQEVIRTTCAARGLRATTIPTPILGGKGPLSGCHLHLSVHPALGSTAFLAGALARLRTLCAFGLANYDSYTRVANDCAGEWVGWGTGNKDLPVCQVSPEHWEFRFLDATANVYLFAAALLIAGLAGVRDGRVLKLDDCQIVPSALASEDAASHLRPFGITERLPTTLAEALATAAADEELGNLIGPELLLRYIGVKEREVEFFGGMKDEERREKLLGYF